MDNVADGHRDQALKPHQIIRDESADVYYLGYSGTGSRGEFACFARAQSPDGPYTDLGPIPGLPVGADHVFFVRDYASWYAFVGVADGPMQLWRSTSLTGPYSLVDRSIIPQGPSGAFDENRTYEPCVFHTGVEPHVFRTQYAHKHVIEPASQTPTWTMLYMGMNSGKTSEQIGIATAWSLTGPWAKASTNPVIRNGAPGGYDSTVCADPFVLCRNGTYWIFYVAGGDRAVGGTGRSCIALATTDDLMTFTKHGPVMSPPPWPARDSCGIWRGSFYVHTDGLVYYPRAGSNRRMTDPAFKAQIYQDVIDPVSFNKPTDNPWVLVEAESADARIMRTGNWDTVMSRPFWNGGGVIYSNTAGSTIAFTFDGTAIRWASGVNAVCGIANVYLDGIVVATVDMYADDDVNPGTIITKVFGYENAALPPGQHVLKIECTGTASPKAKKSAVYVDYFEYIPSS